MGNHENEEDLILAHRGALSAKEEIQQGTELAHKALDATSRGARLHLFHTPLFSIFFPLLKGGLLLMASFIDVWVNFQRDRKSKKHGWKRYENTLQAIAKATLYFIVFAVSVILAHVMVSEIVSSGIVIALSLGLVIYDTVFELMERRQRKREIIALAENCKALEDELASYNQEIVDIQKKLAMQPDNVGLKKDLRNIEQKAHYDLRELQLAKDKIALLRDTNRLQLRYFFTTVLTVAAFTFAFVAVFFPPTAAAGLGLGITAGILATMSMGFGMTKAYMMRKRNIKAQRRREEVVQAFEVEAEKNQNALTPELQATLDRMEQLQERYETIFRLYMRHSGDRNNFVNVRDFYESLADLSERFHGLAQSYQRCGMPEPSHPAFKLIDAELQALASDMDAAETALKECEARADAAVVIDMERPMVVEDTADQPYLPSSPESKGEDSEEGEGESAGAGLHR